MATRVWDTTIRTSSYVAFGAEQGASTSVITDLDRSASIRSTADMRHTAEGQPLSNRDLA